MINASGSAKADNLQSIPSKFGIPVALKVSTLSHAATIVLLVVLGWITSLGWPYWVGLFIVALLLFWEHRLVQPDDLSKIDVAFFNINSYISVTLFLAILSAIYID